jgi:hypothetical protein
VWTGGRNTNSIAWVVELGENRYLRCDLDAGRLVEYEAVATPSASSMFRHWEEQP